MSSFSRMFRPQKLYIPDHCGYPFQISILDTIQVSNMSSFSRMSRLQNLYIPDDAMYALQTSSLEHIAGEQQHRKRRDVVTWQA